jgi:hypothetical protein
MDEVRLYMAARAQLEMMHPPKPNDDFLFTTWQCPVEIETAWEQRMVIKLVDAIIALCEKAKKSLMNQKYLFVSIKNW